MQVFMIFCLVALLWAIYGYSLAFTGGQRLHRRLRPAVHAGHDHDSVAATFSKGVYIPEFVYFVFQLTFACITPCLIVGAFAERIKFSAVLMFTVLWFTFSYLPIAHMVWFWAGPDAYTDAAAGAAAGSTAGFLFQKGALDFAGGTVVHINAGIAGLVGALMLGKRIGYGTAAMPPHNLPLVMIGASLLWVGWFGFNVGSGLEANGFAGMVFANTILATAAAALAWSFAEWIYRGTPTMLGAASGAVAGLVAITPACGWVGPMGAIAIGLIAGLVCLWAVASLKRKLGYDDSLDVFGVHCVGGIIGALLTAVFCSPVARRHRRLRLRGQRRRRVLDGHPVQGAAVGRGREPGLVRRGRRGLLQDRRPGRSGCAWRRTRSARASTPRRTASAPTADRVCGRRPVPGSVAFSPACGRFGARFFLVLRWGAVSIYPCATNPDRAPGRAGAAPECDAGRRCRGTGSHRDWIPGPRGLVLPRVHAFGNNAWRWVVPVASADFEETS